ncbi:universal stress protein [Streptomyces sp. NBC_00289]|uniref:universal stress protein n=1 Tax=Streptomyces sp. NBC_00289 TaxID=2975703 RepID=UPI00324553B3
MERVILVCTDPSSHGRSAVDWAEREARLHGLPLCAVPGSAPDPSRVAMVVGNIPDEADATGPPLGSRSPVAVRAWDCPLVLVPDGPASTHRSGRVVLGVDARAPSGAAIDFAFASARVRGALLHVVHSWSLSSCAAEWPFALPETERATWEDHEVQCLADVLRPWREKYREVPVLEDVVLLTPDQALLHRCESAELVVVGRQPGAECGSVARALLRAATCPVAVVPAR